MRLKRNLTGEKYTKMTGSSESETLLRLAVENERENESKYRAIYAELFQKHKGLLGGLQETTDDDSKRDYAEESKIIKAAMVTERTAMVYGATAGIATFVSLRFFPRYMIWRVGGKAKLKVLKDADAKAKVDNGGIIGKAIALFIEGTFACWIGSKTYQESSKLSEGTYELCARIPLSKGRSVVADNICDKWVDITHRQIPPAFWQNLDGEKKTLTDEPAWRAIRNFSKNCVKRKSFEAKIRKERGITDQEEPVVLLDEVPGGLTDDEAKKLVTDRQ